MSGKLLVQGLDERKHKELQGSAGREGGLGFSVLLEILPEQLARDFVLPPSVLCY